MPLLLLKKHPVMHWECPEHQNPNTVFYLKVNSGVAKCIVLYDGPAANIAQLPSHETSSYNHIMPIPVLLPRQNCLWRLVLFLFRVRLPFEGHNPSNDSNYNRYGNDAESSCWRV